MDSDRRLKQKEVDREIKSLERRFNNGEESEQLYKLKLENLRTMKDLIIKVNKEWKKIKGG